MSDIYFSNFELQDDTEYFIYIGELKNYGLNIFLREALSRIYNRKFDFIAIVPDVFEQYNYPGLIVINPFAESYACRYGSKVSCRVSAAQFMACVSEDRRIKALIRQLLNRQDNLFLYMYESLPEMTLNTIPGVKILGPEPAVSNKLNSKIYQYTHLQEYLPVVDFRVCEGRETMLRTIRELFPQWRDGIFVSREYSAAGVNSIIAYSEKEAAAKFTQPDEKYLISRFIPHDYDPTVLAVTANEDDIYIAGVADQRIENGTRFTGSVFPSVLPKETTDQLREYAGKAGEWLAGQGYRGIYGCDFIVDKNNDIHFLEINARKQGTTLEFCCTLEQSLPPGCPNLPELEYYAVTEGILPLNTMEMEGNPKNLHWGTYNYKIHNTVYTESYIPQGVQEREAFQRIADKNLKKDFLILEHAGSDFIIAEGAFIARIVALGHERSSVDQGLRQGRKTIDLTINETPVKEQVQYA